MSKYSGKCDFCDYIAMVGIENVLASEIFVGKIKVELKELRDCKTEKGKYVRRKISTRIKECASA